MSDMLQIFENASGVQYSTVQYSTVPYRRQLELPHSDVVRLRRIVGPQGIPVAMCNRAVVPSACSCWRWFGWRR